MMASRSSKWMKADFIALMVNLADRSAIAEGRHQPEHLVGHGGVISRLSVFTVTPEAQPSQQIERVLLDAGDGSGLHVRTGAHLQRYALVPHDRGELAQPGTSTRQPLGVIDGDAFDGDV